MDKKAMMSGETRKTLKNSFLELYAQNGISGVTVGAITKKAGYSDAGLLTLIVLMFIGASPGSTGGGIKTSTFFVLLCGIYSAATNKSEKAFRYTITSACAGRMLPMRCGFAKPLS